MTSCISFLTQARLELIVWKLVKRLASSMKVTLVNYVELPCRHKGFRKALNEKLGPYGETWAYT